MFYFRNGTGFREFETYRCKIEINTKDGTDEQMIEAPRIMLEHQIKGMLQQAMYLTKPARIMVSRTQPFYNEIDGCMAEIEYAIEFKNNAWLNEFGEE